MPGWDLAFVGSQGLSSLYTEVEDVETSVLVSEDAGPLK